MPEYKRVRDKDNPSTAYSVVASAFDPALMDEVDEPAVNGNGDPLPPGDTPSGVLGYEGMTVAQLRDAVDARNATAPEDAQLSKSGSKADLIAALTGAVTTTEES
jgi:hypothetical protein